MLIEKHKQPGRGFGGLGWVWQLISPRPYHTTAALSVLYDGRQSEISEQQSAISFFSVSSVPVVIFSSWLSFFFPEVLWKLPYLRRRSPPVCPGA
jgi:hypothetical protein